MANRKPLLEQLFSNEGVVCETPEEMLALGRELSALIQKGTVISLEGPLGAGKTQLSKGVAAALGCAMRLPAPASLSCTNMPAVGFPSSLRFLSAQERG